MVFFVLFEYGIPYSRKKLYYEFWIFLGYLNKNRCTNQAQIYFFFLYIGFVGFCFCTMIIFCIYVVNLYKPFFFLLLIAQLNVRIFIPFYTLIIFLVGKKKLLEVNWVEMTFYCILEVFGNYFTPTIAHMLLPLIKTS